MTEPTTTPMYGPGFRDRRGQLIIAGVLEILIGLFFAGMVPLLLFSMSVTAAMPAAAGPGMSAWSMAAALLVYAGGAVFFIWMAVGTFQARRWARALMLVISSFWLIGGIAGLAVWLWIMPRIFGAAMMGPSTGSSPAIPDSVRIMVQIITTVIAAGLYVVLPGIFLLLYRGEDVRATVEAADPVPRWTDRCPLPVLALVVMLGYSSLGCLFMLAYPLFPFFGVFLTGPAAVVLAILLAGVLAFLTREVYRLRMLGWWGTIVVVLLGGLSYVVTLGRGGLMEMYRKMGFTPQQLQMMQSMLGSPGWLTLWTAAVTVAFLGYVVYLRRYFTNDLVAR